jgi:hypothetical protein
MNTMDCVGGMVYASLLSFFVLYEIFLDALVGSDRSSLCSIE